VIVEKNVSIPERFFDNHYKSSINVAGPRFGMMTDEGCEFRYNFGVKILLDKFIVSSVYVYPIDSMSN
jgi:hypothetical protein